MMKLTITIAQYLEDERILFPLLTSIDNQAGIDFNDIEVHIINDGSEVHLNEQYLNAFLHIKPQYTLLPENIGLGMCRQKGLDTANGQYIMFCDADDRFASSLALFALLQAAEKGYDYISSNWIVENNNKETPFSVQKQEATWVHGKIFRRAYLLEQDIKFHPNLRVHEDSYFVGLAFELTRNRIHVDHTTLLWCWNANSITRTEGGKFLIDENFTFIFAITQLCKVLKAKSPDALPVRVGSFLAHCYFTMASPVWEKHKEKQEECNEAIQKYFAEFSAYYDTIEKEDLAEIYAIKKTQFPPFEQRRSFADFIKSLRACIPQE